MTTVDTSNPYSILGQTNTAINSSIKETSQTFLKLLTTQLQNQDPLNPVDNADFTSQLAQLNTVEGIQNLNAKLESFADQFASAQVLQAVGMIDRQVLVYGNSLVFDGTNSMTGGYDIPSGGADTVKITVYNSAGSVVDTIEVSGASGRNYFEWDGLDSEGEPFPAGNYSFVVDASNNGQTVASTPVSYHRVTSVERSADGSIVVSAGGMQIPLTDIYEII